MKRLRHPEVGELTVYYDYLSIGGRPDLRLVTVTPADAAAEQGVRTLITRHTRRRASAAVRPLAA